MKPEDIQRMLADGKRYEAMRGSKPWPWYVQLFLVIIVLGAIGYFLTGCAAPRPYQPTQYEKDKAECEASAAPARGLERYAVYIDCMHAHGWTK